MISSDWTDGFFDGLMAEFWRAAIPEEVTLAETVFFEERLHLTPGCRVLDVPCGHGRHSLELARRGYRMTGVDFSHDLLAAARRTASERGLDVEWIDGDMRALPWTAEFDAAFCAGNSFGFFDDAGNRACLESVSRALRPGARFVLDSGWVAEAILPNFRERLEMRVGDIRFTAENRYDPAAGSVRNRFTVSRGSETITRPAIHRVHSYRQLAEMLEEAGFRSLEAFGSTEGDPFVLGSHRLLLVATRK